MSAGAALLAWFDRHRRILPWRSTQSSGARPEAYRVWVSEIMLQQTRVETVIPYYERFLERYPTVETLATADLADLLAAWSGLGYYRRARQMHAAAAEIVRRGAFPHTLEGLRELPGIGEYTAAAIGSIAFGIEVAVLDGNVERVISRYLALAGDPKAKLIRRQLLAAASALLDPRRPGDSNQALMELGATLCIPRRPKCLLCPLSPDCRATAEGDPHGYPSPRKRRAPVRVRRMLAWVEGPAGVLLFRRPEESQLLAGTWELPWFDRTTPAQPQAPAKVLAAKYGGQWTIGPAITKIRHAITHRNIEAEIHRCQLTSVDTVAEGPEAGWYQPSAITDLATSSLVDKAVAAVAGSNDRRS